LNSQFSRTWPALFTIAFLVGPAPCQTPSYTISTIAGTGTAGFAGDGGAATAAEIYNPIGVVADAAGNLYFSDYINDRIRKISLSGTITTVAGTGTNGYNGDNIQGTAANLGFPYYLAVDAAGNLYIADTSSSRIRKLATNGIITTVAGGAGAGYAGDGGPATSAQLDRPDGVAVDASGNIYIADSLNNVIRKVSASTGIITTIAGTGVKGFTGDGGSAVNAKLNLPVDLAVDPSGNVFFSDQDNDVVRKIDTSGVITTVAGSGKAGYGGDGGPATSALLNGPAGVALDAAGNLYIGEVGSSRIRAVSASGTITTVAGDLTAGGFSGDGGPATGAALYQPRGVAVGPYGDVYIADYSNNRIRRLATASIHIGFMANAFDNQPVFAANTWVYIRGANLSPAGDSRQWQASDFNGDQMPTSMDGVSVKMNGASAYIYYISPGQLNVLTPPNLAPGIVQVQVTANGQTSATSFVQSQALSASFFVFDGTHVVGTHLNGTDIGPTTLYAGLTTPAHPGEEVVLYANGFGPTSDAVVAGLKSQSGSLPALPVVTIGGVQANVIFAGLVGPGLYQFNVYVPASTPTGDIPMTATFNGTSTQSGVVITVQQ
jgi:uncharacterized protein (TIGR03437 family)